MKSLTNAILSIASALNRIAAALETKSLIQPKQLSLINKHDRVNNSTTTTTTVPTVSSVYYSNEYSTVHISRQEKNALDRVYNAISEKGVNPKHHDKIMSDLSKKWPTLSSALIALVAAKSKSDKQTLNKNTSNIWNYKDNY
jgi:murein L,D-transpeptidase YcbB/YkuD